MLKKWCPQCESNTRPLPYHGSALPTELCGLKLDLEIKKALVLAIK